jgi:hypothetical protein
VENRPTNFIDIFGLKKGDANEVTFGEFGQCAIISIRDLKAPDGLGDAKASLYAVCKRGQKCASVDGSKRRDPGDKAAWKNIKAANGSDKSNGATNFCVGTTQCWFVEKCCACLNPSEEKEKQMFCLVKRKKPLEPVATLSVPSTNYDTQKLPDGCKIYFYKPDPKNSNCPKADGPWKKEDCLGPITTKTCNTPAK